MAIGTGVTLNGVRLRQKPWSAVLTLCFALWQFRRRNLSLAARELGCSLERRRRATFVLLSVDLCVFVRLSLRRFGHVRLTS
jgi:hypothetical protein